MNNYECFKIKYEDVLRDLNSFLENEHIEPYPYTDLDKDVFIFLFGDKNQGIIKNEVFNNPINKDLFNYLNTEKKSIVGFEVDLNNNSTFYFALIPYCQDIL